jgi:hypothetical protein
MIPHPVEVRYLGGHRVWLRFDDGAEGEVDLGSRLMFHGVFEPLADPANFAKVWVDHELGTICWPTGADVDPLVLWTWVTGNPLPEWARGSPA